MYIMFDVLNDFTPVYSGTKSLLAAYLQQHDIVQSAKSLQQMTHPTFQVAVKIQTTVLVAK